MNNRLLLSGNITSRLELKGDLNGSFRVLPPHTQEKTVAPSIVQQEVTPDEYYTGLSKVTVTEVTNDIDSNITPDNIKKDVTVLGVIGTLEELNAQDSVTVTPTKNVQTIVPETGYNALSEVKVEAIPEDYIIPTGTRNITANGTYNIKEYEEAIVNVGDAATLQEKTATPTTSQQLITADEGYDGLSSVTVEAVTNTIDSNILAENIKKGVSILGVEGSFEGGYSVSVTDDILVLNEGTVTEGELML